MTFDAAMKWAERLTEYFGKDYANVLIIDIQNEMRSMSESQAEKVFAQLKATLKTSFKVDVQEIQKARAKLGFLTDGAEQLECATVTWICQACAKSFNFNANPGVDDWKLGIMGYCPNCGFVPRVTMRIDGSKIFYSGDQKAIERMEMPRPGKKQSEIEYYRAKTSPIFNRDKEMKSEDALFVLKGIYKHALRVDSV